jgi:hypothetical protein
MSLFINGEQINNIYINSEKLNTCYLNGEQIFSSGEGEDDFFVQFYDAQMQPKSGKITPKFLTAGQYLQYKTSENDWTDFASGTELTSPNDGKIYFRGYGRTTLFINSSSNNNWITSDLFTINGNINRLLNDDDPNNVVLGSYAFSYMFAGNNFLFEANIKLPSMNLNITCYQYMFKNCQKLINAPELPATTLESYCYNGMFDSCISLINAPELPATTLQECCYGNMFYNCTKLTAAPELPATIAPYTCYQYTFYSCINLTTAPELPATTLGYGCYQYMFYGCTNLTVAPELPATTLTDACYQYMFYNCSNLMAAPAVFPATTLAQSCYQYMFANCTNLIIAPALPATTLVQTCYYGMFYNCNNLLLLDVNFTNWNVTNATKNWTLYTSSMGVFYKPAALSAEFSGDRIPYNWTIIDK